MKRTIEKLIAADCELNSHRVLAFLYKIHVRIELRTTARARCACIKGARFYMRIGISARVSTIRSICEVARRRTSANSTRTRVAECRSARRPSPHLEITPAMALTDGTIVVVVVIVVFNISTILQFKQNNAILSQEKNAKKLILSKNNK